MRKITKTNSKDEHAKNMHSKINSRLGLMGKLVSSASILKDGIATPVVGDNTINA